MWHLQSVCPVCLLSQPFVPLVSRPPGLPPSGDWRRKGRQMTKCFEYRRASYSQILVVLFFFANVPNKYLLLQQVSVTGDH